MSLVTLSIRHGMAVKMLSLAIVFTGLAALTVLPLDLAPNVSLPRISVVATWPDSALETIEALVTSRIEAAVNTLPGVAKTSSVSEPGRATIDIEFSRGTDMNFAALYLNETLAMLYEDLPHGIPAPEIRKVVPREFQAGRFLTYTLTGPSALAEIRRIALKELRGPLLAVNGVAEVEIEGGDEPEVQVELKPSRLFSLGFSISEVLEALQSIAHRVSGGSLSHNGRDFDVVMDKLIADAAHLQNTMVVSYPGRVVRLCDISRVSIGQAPAQSHSRVNGNPAVIINIEKEAGSNAVRVANRVYARMTQLQQRLPGHLKLIKQHDQSEPIRRELKRLASCAGLCLVLIILALLAVFRDLGHTLVVVSSILIAALLTVNLFFMIGQGLNMITLAGLALAFGMMVDGSLVIVDNIDRARERGLPSEQAADEGCREMILPVVASSCTTIVAFLPFLYLTGELKIYYLPFALTVALSLAASLLVAFTWIPSLSALHLTRSAKAAGFAFLKTDLAKYLAHVVTFSIHNRFFVLGLALLLLAGSYYLFRRNVSFGSSWSFGKDTSISVLISLPPGARLEDMDSVVRSLENYILQSSFPKKTVAVIMATDARLHITFPPAVQRTPVPANLHRKLTTWAMQIAGAEVGVFGSGPGFYSHGSNVISQFRLKVLGYDYLQTKHLAQEIGRRLSRYARVKEVNTSSSEWGGGDERLEIVLKLNRKKLRQYGVTANYVLQELQPYVGESVQQLGITLSGQEPRLRIRMQGSRDFNLHNLQSLLISTPHQGSIRLSEICEISERKVSSQIVRENQQYRYWISFEYRGRWEDGDKLVRKILTEVNLPDGFTLEDGSVSFMPPKDKRELYLVLVLAFMLVYMVTAGLFESLLQPFVVILTVPLALIGVFGIFSITGKNFDRSAFIGVVLLAGIVVNNSIILIHHVNSLRRNGLDFESALVQGALDRLRPILITSVTTILGLLPFVLVNPPDDSIWYGLSLATIGGLLISTPLIFTVITAAYAAFAKRELNDIQVLDPTK